MTKTLSIVFIKVFFIFIIKMCRFCKEIKDPLA